MIRGRRQLGLVLISVACLLCLPGQLVAYILSRRTTRQPYSISLAGHCLLGKVISRSKRRTETSAHSYRTQQCSTVKVSYKQDMYLLMYDTGCIKRVFHY